MITTIKPSSSAILQVATGNHEELEFDFVRLHNMAKHIMYLREGTHTAVALVKHICGGHESIMAVSSLGRLELMRSFHDVPLHKSSLLESLVSRVAGMESLAQNLINLIRKGLTFPSQFLEKLLNSSTSTSSTRKTATR